MPWPKKEGVVSESIVFNGRKYNRYPNSKKRAHREYFTIGGGGSLLHRDVWEFYNGPIPEGMHVHHKDGDTGNNAVENLECLTFEAHFAEHYDARMAYAHSDEQHARLAAIRPKAAEWHKSPEGKEWHRQNTAKHLMPGGAAYVAKVAADEYRRNNPDHKVCEECGAAYTTTSKKSKFCSNNCSCRSSRRNRAERKRVQSFG
jgi:predicted nucleic acid-binding Zn ribbon protein